MLSRGRLGSLVAGLGFMLPGFMLMLLCAWLYTDYGIQSEYVQASFRSVQPAVAALVLRGLHRISETALFYHGSGGHGSAGTHTFSLILFFIAGLSAIQAVMRVNFFVILVFGGILFSLANQVEVRWPLAKITAWLFFLVLWFAGGCLGYAMYAKYNGVSDGFAISAGGVTTNSDQGLFLSGLFAGLLTFGGAYTAIPFVQSDAVVANKWLTNEQFLDGLAIGSVLPAPLVIFVTFDGFIARRFTGAILMTVGMFLPAFSFTFLGHSLFERVVTWKVVSKFLDGVTASVVGLVFITAFQLISSGIGEQYSAVLFVLSLGSLYMFKGKVVPPAVVIGAAIAGQMLYINQK